MLIFEEWEALLIYSVQGFEGRQKIEYKGEICMSFKGVGPSRQEAVTDAQKNFVLSCDRSKGFMDKCMRVAIRLVGSGDGGYVDCDARGWT